MKHIFLIMIVFLFGCATSPHNFISKDSETRAFSYCKSELFGYMIPLGPREDKPWYSRKTHDPMPLMGVYLHLHSDFSKDPNRALRLFLDIRSKESFKLKIPDQSVEVKIDNAAAKKITTEFTVIEQAKTAKEMFPPSRYKIRLVDAKENKWSVSKVNSWLTFVTGSSETVQLPVDKSYDLGTEEKDIKLDKKLESKIWIRASEDIWNSKEALRNAKISIRIPKLIVNGQLFEARELIFDMKYDSVKKSSPMKCPSTEMIFHGNDRTIF